MPDETNSPDFSNLRVRTVQQAKSDLPQPQYMAPAENLTEGTKLGKAYDAAKNWLGEHEQHLSEKYLAPFRQGLDNMAEDLQTAGETGHTKSGGQLNPVARALASGAGGALKAVPVGKDAKETAAMLVAPPELGEEEALAYRARPVGQKGIAAGERPVATSSLDKAKEYRESLESMTGKPHEVVQVPLKAGEHTKHVGPEEGETWYSFKKAVPEENVKVHGSQSEQKPSPKEIIEKQGMVYKGELTKGSGVHLFEDPQHPGKTASLKEADITPTGVKTKMASKIKEFQADSESEQNRNKLISHINKKDWYHVPPEQGSKAYAHRGQFLAASQPKAEFYAPFGAKIESHKVSLANPLVGTEQEITDKLGIAPQHENMTYEEMRAHDRSWGLAAKKQGYDAIVTVAPKQWETFKTTGKIPSDMEVNSLRELKSDAELRVDKAKNSLQK